MAVSLGQRGSHRLARCGAAWEQGPCPCGLTRPNPRGSRFRLCPNGTTSPGDPALNVSEGRGEVNVSRNPRSRSTQTVCRPGETSELEALLCYRRCPVKPPRVKHSNGGRPDSAQRPATSNPTRASRHTRERPRKPWPGTRRAESFGRWPEWARVSTRSRDTHTKAQTLTERRIADRSTRKNPRKQRVPA